MAEYERIAADPSGRLLLKAPDVAHLLSMSTSSVYDYAKSGAIPSVRIGTSLRFRLQDIRALLGEGAPHQDEAAR